MNNFLRILPAILLLTGFVLLIICGFMYSLFTGLLVTGVLLCALATLLAPSADSVQKGGGE